MSDFNPAIKLTRAERQKMLRVAQGLGAEIEKHNIDKDTAKEMILIALEASAKELLERRDKKK
jgi:hypothetical protein